MVASTSPLPDDGVADAATNEESVDGPSRPRGVRRMVHLPGHHRSAHAARVLLREVLTAAGSPEWLPGAEIACTELVTNVVLHAHTDLELTVEVTDVLRVAVRDYNSTLPLQRHYPLDATTGRGLGLVAAVSNAHGIADAGPDGKTLWFVIGKPAGDRPRDERDTDWDGASWTSTACVSRSPGPVPRRSGCWDCHRLCGWWHASTTTRCCASSRSTRRGTRSRSTSPPRIALASSSRTPP